MGTVMDQRDNYDIPIMNVGAVRTLQARFVASNDNVEPKSDEECDVDADVVPWADFGVSPRGAKFAKIMKCTAQVWAPPHVPTRQKSSKVPELR